MTGKRYSGENGQDPSQRCDKSQSRKSRSGKLLSLFREEWKIENRLHNRRDVIFHEDATRQTKGNAGHNMGILNNITIGLCLGSGFDNLERARRFFDANHEVALQLITSSKLPTL
jgi:hypothetical protein